MPFDALTKSKQCGTGLERTRWNPPPAVIDRGRQGIDFRGGVRETSDLHATLTLFVLAVTIHYHPRLDSVQSNTLEVSH